MFSFFKSKKHSPDHTAEAAIPGPAPPAPKEDEFIFIERKGSTPETPSRSSGIYPSIPAPAVPVTGGYPAPVRQFSEEKTSHIMQGVPFKLSAELAKDDNLEITQYQANEILSFIGKMSHARLDYDFSLERSVLSAE